MPDAPLQPVRDRDAVELTFSAPRRSWQRRFTSTARLWARSTFSRDSYISSLKSLLWVVPLTVLIWIYAEREQVVTLNNVIIKVEAPAEDSGRVVRLSGPSTAATTVIHAEMRGPQADIDQVKDWIENTIIPIEIDHSLTRGEHQIDIAAQLNKLPKVQNKGVTVINCVPSEVRVSIDPLVEREVEVRARSQDFVGPPPPVFTPARVRIRGPESEIDRAYGAGQLFAYANLRQFAALLSEGGKHDIDGVPVSPPMEMNPAQITFSPPAVTAHVEVPTSQKTIQLPYVTVWAAYPEVGKADQYRAKYTSTVNNVHVTGPVAEITALETGATPAFAYFRVDLDSPDINAPRPAPLIFDLPPGVHVADQDKNRTISYTLEPRPKADP